MKRLRPQRPTRPRSWLSPSQVNALRRLRRGRPRSPFGLDEAHEDAMLEWCVDLVDEAREPGVRVLVEGPRDRRALAPLLGEEPALIIHAGPPIEGRIRDLAELATSLIILTDYDDKGYQLDRHVRRYARAHGLACDYNLKKSLKRASSGRVRAIEDLRRWLEEMAPVVLERIDGPLREAG